MTAEPWRPHVLVIDDAPSILELMRDLLEGEGFRVSTRTPAPGNLDEIKSLRPSVIILDGLRPGQGAGWPLLEMLKLDPGTRTIPVVLCTGGTRQVEALAGRLTAMDIPVVRKPFDIDQLLAVVQTSLCAPALI